MHFERRNAFQNAYDYIFFQKKIIKQICVPTLAKIFRPVTRKTLIVLFGLTIVLLSMTQFASTCTINKTHNLGQSHKVGRFSLAQFVGWPRL